MEDVTIQINNDIVWIKINNIISLNDLFYSLYKNGLKENLIISDRLFLCNDIIGSYLYPQKIYALKKDNNVFNISYLNDNKYVIANKIINNNMSSEYSFLFDDNNIKKYSKCELDNIRRLLMKVDEYKISRYIDIDTLYHKLHIRPLYDYNYVIENDKIALSIRNKNLNNVHNGDFDIILKKTKEHIGNIEIDNHGEVSYFVDKPFRGNHYATDALGLLITYLKQKKKTKMDISLVALNELSKKVIINNGGIFEEIIPYMDGNYPMYSIKI